MKLILAITSYLLLFTASSAHADPARIIYGVPARISSLNPYLISGIESFTVTGFMIESLARVQPHSQELTPWLAETWAIDKASKSIRVRLRKNVKFHNGEPLTAEDIKFTWNSYANPEYKGEIWKAMWSEIESIKVIDQSTALITLKSFKFQAFQNVMTALRILPKSYYGKINHKEWGTKIVGSGPFKLESFESNKALQLAVNGDWWGWKQLNLDPASPITVKAVTDAKLAELMVHKGELDIYEVPSGLQPPQSAKWLASQFGRGISLGINFRKADLENPELRKALTQLWNRSAISEKVFDSRFKLALDSFTPTTKYYPKGTPIAYAPSAAIKTIKGLGYTSEKPLTLKVLAGQPGSERWLGFYQADAAKAGVKIEIENVADETQWWQLLNQGKFDLVAYDGALSEAPHPPVWHSKGPYNSSGIHDKSLDEMLDKLEGEFALNKRDELQGKIIKYLREIHAEIPGLATTKTAFLLSPEVTLDSAMPLEAWRWRKKLRH